MSGRSAYRGPRRIRGYGSAAERERFLLLQLHAHVQDLSFPACCHLIRYLLLHSGYDTVRTMGSGTTRKFTGQGGVDLLAFSHTDFATSITAIQVKQSRDPISRRFVDELRGAMPRVGAEQGMIFATCEFSALTFEAAGEPGRSPVVLVDGFSLARRLHEHKIGLRPVHQVSGYGWQLDPRFFETLELRAKSKKPEVIAPNFGGAES
jgi:restriction endonuclease Mrr